MGMVRLFRNCEEGLERDGWYATVFWLLDLLWAAFAFVTAFGMPRAKVIALCEKDNPEASRR